MMRETAWSYYWNINPSIVPAYFFPKERLRSKKKTVNKIISIFILVI